MARTHDPGISGIALATGELRSSARAKKPKVLTRYPLGTTAYPRTSAETALVEAVIEPTAVDNEEEAYGRNAGAETALLSHRGANDVHLAGL